MEGRRRGGVGVVEGWSNWVRAMQLKNKGKIKRFFVAQKEQYFNICIYEYMIKTTWARFKVFKC